MVRSLYIQLQSIYVAISSFGIVPQRVIILRQRRFTPVRWDTTTRVVDYIGLTAGSRPPVALSSFVLFADNLGRRRLHSKCRPDILVVVASRRRYILESVRFYESAVTDNGVAVSAHAIAGISGVLLVIGSIYRLTSVHWLSRLLLGFKSQLN